MEEGVAGKVSDVLLEGRVPDKLDRAKILRAALDNGQLTFPEKMNIDILADMVFPGLFSEDTFNRLLREYMGNELLKKVETRRSITFFDKGGRQVAKIE